MRAITLIQSSILTLSFCASAIAQQPLQKPDFPVDAAYRTKVIEGVSQKLGDGYFDAKIGNTIATQLSKKSVRSAYDTCATAASLSTALTRDLQTWSHDRHVQVVFSVEPRPLQAKGSTDADFAGGEGRNFGFFALTRFTGNVGYIEVGRFYPAALAGPTLQAVMQFVANTDALIIDLRQNGGGRADMVALFASYFLNEQTKLATMERRDKSASDQIWSASYVPGPKYLNKPVYILTSKRTFSGAEALAYDLKHFANATIIGENTRGGANPGSFDQIDEHFAVFVPTARVVHASTGGNWDEKGIAPDVAVEAKDASRTALKLALQRLVAEKPGSNRFTMWKEALDDMFPTATK
ncbi:MAG TPA: S41 family peptidase [Longimicrobiales bacterium]|nr:S41 family peptidase [Longimicrobiales bacterium]